MIKYTKWEEEAGPKKDVHEKDKTAIK